MDWSDGATLLESQLGVLGLDLYLQAVLNHLALGLVLEHVESLLKQSHLLALSLVEGAADPLLELHLLLFLLVPLVFEVVTKVQDSDGALLTADRHVSLESKATEVASLLLLIVQLELLLPNALNQLLADGLGQLDCREWLHLVVHHIEPTHVHFELRVVRSLPKHYLGSLM